MKIKGTLFLLAFAASTTTLTGAANAQDSRLGVRASVGMFTPVQDIVVLTSLIDPDVALETSVAVRAGLDFRWKERLSFYLGLDHVRTRMNHSSALALGGPARPDSEVRMLIPTGGLIVSLPILGRSIYPTLRLGGGMKFYKFDITEIPNGIQDLTLDVGVGLSTQASESVWLVAEGRWLGSLFDHSFLPLRSQSNAEQLLSDWVFQLGVRFGA